MPQKLKPRLSPLTVLPEEIQAQIYQDCYPDEWSLNIHPQTIGMNFKARHKISHSSSQSQNSTSCCAENHPRNPNKGLLFTCKSISKIVQPIIKSRYSGIISICPDTIRQSESLVPDVCVSMLTSFIRRNPFLNSPTHTLELRLDQLRSRFASHLCEQLYDGDAELLPQLQAVVWKDDAYCYVSDYFGAGGIAHIYMRNLDFTSMNGEGPLFEELCFEIAHRRFVNTVFKEWEVDDDDLINASAMSYARWLPGFNNDGRATDSSGEHGRELSLRYHVRFRIEDIEEQAYEARFVAEKQTQPAPLFLGRNLLGRNFFGRNSQARLCEILKLTEKEDLECDWNEAAEADVTSLNESDEDADIREYLEDEFLSGSGNRIYPKIR